MADKWVEQTGYVGPDRRKRPGPKRLMDRRRRDETSASPGVNALLRRVRVQLLGIYSAEDRLRVLQLLSATTQEAHRQRLYECAKALQQAERLLRSGPSGDVTAADAALQQAMSLAADGR